MPCTEQSHPTLKPVFGVNINALANAADETFHIAQISDELEI
jgi:hypothetical protein